MAGILESHVGEWSCIQPMADFGRPAYWLSVMSSIVGPVVERASRPGPLMVTLPMEVVTGVHIGYSCKFIFHYMTGAHGSNPWGWPTVPWAQHSTGALSSTSTSSGSMQTQLITPAEASCGGVGSHMSAKACIDGEGWGRVGILQRGDWQLYGYHLRRSGHAPTFSLGVLVSQGISLVATTRSGWVQHLLPSCKLWGSSFQHWL